MGKCLFGKAGWQMSASSSVLEGSQSSFGENVAGLEFSGSTSIPGLILGLPVISSAGHRSLFVSCWFSQPDFHEGKVDHAYLTDHCIAGNYHGAWSKVCFQYIPLNRME